MLYHLSSTVDDVDCDRVDELFSTTLLAHLARHSRHSRAVVLAISRLSLTNICFRVMMMLTVGQVHRCMRLVNIKYNNLLQNLITIFNDYTVYN